MNIGKITSEKSPSCHSTAAVKLRRKARASKVTKTDFNNLKLSLFHHKNKLFIAFKNSFFY